STPVTGDHVETHEEITASAEQPLIADVAQNPGAPEEYQDQGISNPDASESDDDRIAVGSVFPSRGMSRKDDFISAARRAALENTADSDSAAETSETAGSMAPLTTSPQEPASDEDNIKTKLSSIVRSLPRPPFVILAIAAFTASAGILTAERLLNSSTTSIRTVETAALTNKATATRVTLDNSAKGLVGRRQIAQTSMRNPANLKLAKPLDETRRTGQVSGPGRTATLSIAKNRTANTVTENARVLSVPQSFPKLKDTEITNSIPNGFTIAKPTITAPDKVGRQILKPAGKETAAAQSSARKTTAKKPKPHPSKATRAQVARGKETAPKGAARPKPQPKLSLPPTSIGSLALRRAAANGHMIAQYEIATRFAHGKGVKRNHSKAAKWFKRAAARRFAPAEYRVATLFERGQGLTKDLGLARIWYRRAAENGNVKAMHNLAVLHSKGVNGTADYAEAAFWFEKAAGYGLVDSQYNLALLYQSGLGVSKDLSASYKWLSLAFDRGDKEAGARRNTLRKQLSEDARKFAELATQQWRAKAIKRAANVVGVPIDGWQGGPKINNLLSATKNPKPIKQQNG
ncbi:MAG: tetratricopeptide repeat protein, partial [Methyloligellaceae bacterium]